ENGKQIPQRKSFLSEVKDGVVPVTIWTYQEVGHTHEANNDLKNLSLGGVFDNPKPVKLLRRILDLVIQSDEDLVLDFFAGSGTTG
ncbi:DNA methyltransferase, partial [Escherichia coli]